MSEKTLKTRIRHAVKTESEWASSNPVLLSGEIAYNSDNDKYKVGNGSSTWSQLSYRIPVSKSDIGLGNVENKSSATIRGELTKDNVTTALGYTPPTTNTTYGVATSSALGLVKSGTDITVDSSGNVSVKDDSHNHIISNIDGLQSALDTKKPSEPTTFSLQTNYVGVRTANRTASQYYEFWDSVGWANIHAGSFTTHGNFIGNLSGNADSASSVPWSGITGKPSTFTPSDHTHDSRYYTESEIDTKLNTKLNTSLKGTASGLAELDSTGRVPSSQLPSYVDDVIEGYLYNSKFYKESAHTTQITGETGKIYVDLTSNKTYRWSGSAFVVISETLALGETSATAYRGDRGKIAYDHSQVAHAPSNAEVNQNAFSNVTVGSTTIAADSKTDTLTLVAGSNVTLTPDATNDKITISSTNTDTKVTQTAVTSSDYTNWRPLIWGASNSSTEGFTPTTVTDSTFTANTISCQPSSGTIRASVFKGNLTGNADTASKIYVTQSNPSSGTMYRIPLISGNGNNSVLSNNGIRYWTYEGTTTSVGTAEIGLGNDIAYGTAGNKRGILYLYGTSSGYTDIVPGNNTTSNVSITLPATSGTLALTTSNVSSANKWATPRTLSLTGAVTGSASIDGSGNVSLSTSVNHTHNYAGSDSAGGSATNANSLLSQGVLDTQEKIDNFITPNKLQYSLFKTNDTNNIGMVTNDGMLLSIPWSSASYGAQIAIDDYTTGTIKIRGKSNNWGSWYTLLHSGNYTNYITPSNIGAATSSHTHTKSQITDFPSSLPASDVYAWAKASSKPSYSWDEITAKPSSFTPASHTHTSVNNVTPEWSGSVAWADTGWIAAWNSDGTKIKALNKNSFAPASHTHSYLPLSGGTLTGLLTLKGDVYEDTYTGALNANNSNIYGVNSLIFADLSDSAGEGIQFYRDSSHVDSLWGSSGVLYWTPNRSLGDSGTNYTIYHSGNLTKSVLGLGNVENKSSATIRSEITSSNVTTALGFTPSNSNHTHNYAGSTSAGGAANTAVKLSTARTIQTNLSSTSSASFDGSANITPGITGTLPIANGGTGKTTAKDAANNLINNLGVGDTAPTDDSSIIMQGIGAYSDQYYKKPSSLLWEYIKGKISSVLGLTVSSYGGSANSAIGLTKHTITSMDALDDFSSSDFTMKFASASNCDIGWGSKDGLIISLPWSSTYGSQIAIDDQSNWMGFRSKNNGTWNSWSVLLSSTNYTSYCTPANIGAAPASHTHSYLPLTGGTMTGVTNYGNGSHSNIMLRTDANWKGGIGWDNQGNEALSLWAINSATRLRWYAGKDMSSMTSGTMMGITPDFEISKADGTAKGYIGGTQISVNGHTHNYAGSSSAGGSATSAVKLDSSAGSATQPIYFSDGKPVACTYSLGKSVPSDAKFTDTVYTHPTSAGNKHIPSGGSSGQILGYSASGTAQWTNTMSNLVVNGTLSQNRYADSTVGSYSSTLGYNCTASGDYCISGGYGCSATGSSAIALGYNAIANTGQLVIGHWGSPGTGTTSGNASSKNAFVIGNGSTSGGSVSVSNAFRVTYAGAVIGKAAYQSTGADFAELREWSDGNPNNEDRRGYFVTMDGMNIRIASPGDYICGIISANPSVIGNNDEDWMGRYVFDDFGAFIYEDYEETDPETGEVRTFTRYKENPEYDPTREYEFRADRPEWDYVGLCGVIHVRDDGTCQQNGFCKCAAGGIATASERGYRVLERVNDHIVKVLFYLTGETF